MQCYGEEALLLYDDKCYYCTRFALFVHNLYAHLGYSIVPMGLYTIDGYKVKRSILYEYSSNPDGMFWFIQIEPDSIKAYGGRAALLKLIIELIKGIVCRKRIIGYGRVAITVLNEHHMHNNHELQCMKAYDRRCGLLSRFSSLLANSKKVTIVREHKN
ncbi:MAG: hypothetical protein ACK4FV_03660 [Candidatus Nitrosocaldus sp.]